MTVPLMRLPVTFIFFLILGTVVASAQSREDIVLTGAPALRFLEHGKAASHDFYWFNFVDASVIRLKELRDEAKPDELVTWAVYRPGYVARSHELEMDLLPQIEAKAKQLDANLFWFDTKEALIDYLNKGRDRDKIKIASFDYFGHSNKACFLFDYSNTVDTMSITFLHVRDLKKIETDDFSKHAMCKSWGCHSGEMYSQWWKSHFDIPMIGAIGKTDFSHGGEPVLSNADGKWTQ